MKGSGAPAEHQWGVVHVGLVFTGPVVVDDGVVARFRELTALAPLHQPRAIAAITAARSILPDATHVACFDTAFHATLPAAAYVYALPAAWRERWPVRCFGFHGLSHSYAARRAAVLMGSLHADVNAGTTGDGEISAPGARVRTFVVTAREDLEVARQVRSLSR
jgi:acetate kinase